jgi:serine/threonine protein kinase
MSSISFIDNINQVSSNELHSLKGITKNVQKQINDLNLDNIANGNTNKYIINDVYEGTLSISSNLNVGTYYSSENQNGNLRVFGDLILEGDITTFNPLITQIHRHLSNYNIGYIDIHNIDDTSNKPSIKIRHNTGYSNILECINNLHSLNIYHGDIQPINIMFSIKKNKYYLIDFGASIIVNNTEWLNNDYEMFKEVPNSYKIKFLKEKDNLSLNDLIKQISIKDLNRLKKEIAYIKDIGEFNRFLYHKIGHLYIKQKKLYINDYENKLFFKN